ncbi:MAG: ATP-grasp domain-containing protein [Colwellia sp.]|nr:ATP-grasp domain-containing protein [Colwellia sp.]
MLNKEKVLFVGVGPFQTLAIKQLKAKGYYVIGVDGSDAAGGKKCCDEFHVINFTLIEDFLQLAMESHVVFAICVECDPAIYIVNEINKQLGKNYFNDDACQASDNKEITRQLQKKLSLPHPQFYQINSADELFSLLAANDNPSKSWVLKPKSSSGSRGVVFINADSNLSECYQQSIAYAKFATEGLLLEEFINGREIALDGFVDEGEINILTLSYKDRTPAPYLLDEGLFITAERNTALLEKCQVQLHSLFSALQDNISSPFHVEMILGDNFLFIVEFSFRGAGFNVFSKWIPEVTQINTIEQQVNQINFQPLVLPKQSDYLTENLPNNSLYIGFLSGVKGILKKITGEAEIRKHPNLLAYEFYPQVGDQIKPLTSGADRVGYIAVEADDYSSAKSLFKALANKLVLTYD